MNYYFIACRTGGEEKVRAHLNKFFTRELGEVHDVFIFIPMRRMIDRRKGKKIMTDHPILPGYLLVSSEEDLQISHSMCIGFPVATAFSQLDKTIELRDPTMSTPPGSCTTRGRSSVEGVYKQGEPIKVVEGPLKDFMGTIISVDYRHSRVMVEFQFADVIRKVSMPVEFIQPDRENYDLD
jgi:transcriptional antiterminator NusG